MICTACGNTVKENRFCTRCGSSLPPSKGVANAATLRENVAFHHAATLSPIPQISLAATIAVTDFAPTTRRLANSTTAQQASAPTTVPVTTAIAVLPRKPALRHLVWMFPLLFVVSGFWWGRQSTVLAQLQGFIQTPSTSEPTPAPLASTSIEVPAVAPVETLPAPANQIAEVEEAQPQLEPESQPQPQPVLKSHLHAQPQAHPKLRSTFKPEPRIQQAQTKPQAPRPLAEQLKAQKKPEAILVLEVKGDFGKKGKKMKEMCDKN